MKIKVNFWFLLCIFLIFSVIGLLLTIVPQNAKLCQQYYYENSPEFLDSKDFSFNQLPLINATLFCESNNNSNHLLITGNPTNPTTSAEIAMDLPCPPQYDQWLGWNTSIKVYNLIDNRTWGNNCDFASGTDDGAPTVDQTDATSYFHNDTISSWEVYHNEEIGVGYYNDMTVEYDASEDAVNLTYYAYDMGFFAYDNNEYVGIRQNNFDVYRGAIKNAWIMLIYDPVQFFNRTTTYFAVSAKINGIEVYRKSNYDLLGITSVNTGWRPLAAWSNQSAVFPAPSASGYTDFNFSFSIENAFYQPFGIGSTIEEGRYQRVQVRGVYLAIEALALPNGTDIQLKANNQKINGSFGEGSIKWTNEYPNFIQTNPYPLIFNSSSADSFIDLTFDVDVNFHVFKFASTTKTQSENDVGVNFEIENNRIKYTFYLYNYWDFTTFSEFKYNFSIPTDWNITFIRNPALSVIYNKSSGYNLGIIGGQAPDGYLLVPTRNGTGDLLAQLPGWWYFEAEGPNYISNIEILKKVGLSWVQSAEFNSTGLSDGDLIKIRTNINNDTGIPPGIGASAAVLRILLPNGTPWVSQTNSSIDPSTGEVTFGPFTLAGINTTGGQFQAQVYWNHSHDYFSGYEKVKSSGSYYYGAGYAQANFTVIHDAELILINPLDAQADLEADLNYFDVFTLKVELNDTDSNKVIGDSIVQINWTGLLSLNEVSEGLYSTSLDTNDLAGPGIYYISINSSKFGFTNATLGVKLNIIAESVLDMLISPAPAEFGSNFTAQMFYHLPSNGNYNYSNAIMNISMQLGSGYLTENLDYVMTDLLNGTYAITIFTGETEVLNETGEVQLYIHASKTFIANATKALYLYINPTSTNLVTNKSIYTAGFFENITLFVNYTVASDSSPILGANITISGHDSLNYSIQEEGGGLYSIRLNVSSIATTYDLIITASKTNYEQSSVNFVLSVDDFNSILENLVPITPKILSENISMLLFYYEPGNQLRNYTGAALSVSLSVASNYLVQNVDYIYSDNANGTYSLILYTGDGTDFNQTGQYSVYIHASRIYVKNASRRIDIFLNAYMASLTSNQTLFSRYIYENATLFVNYTKVDSSSITGANINISGHGGLSYTFQEIGNGIYSVEFNCSSLVTSYNILITASKSNYEQKSVNFILIVDNFDSTLERLGAVIPKTLSENITLSLFYYEPGNPNQNYTGALLRVSRYLTSDYLVENIDFIYADNLNGTYRLILYTGNGTNFNQTGQYNVYIHASKVFIKNASRKVDIFLNAYTTSLTSNQTLFSQRMYENATLYVNFTKVDLTPILGALISVSGEGGLSYNIIESGNGLYLLELNCSSLVHTYNIIVTASKANYEQKSVNFILIVDYFESSFESLSAMAPKTLSENISLYMFYYQPGNPAQNYTGAVLNVSLNPISNFLLEYVDYFYQDHLNGTYTVILFTGMFTSFNETGQYSIYVHASCPYVKNASRKIDIFLNAYQTSLTTNQTIYVRGMYENITLYLNFTLSTDSSPVLNANITISGHGGLLYQVQEIGNGIYTIEINTSNVKTSYDILVLLSKPNHEPKSLSFILSVSEYNTLLTTNHSLIIQAQSNQNVTLYVNYTKEDGTPVDNANLQVSGISLIFSKKYLGNGLYSVEINASNIFANYDIVLILNKTNYKQKSISFVLAVNVLDSILEVVRGQSLINFRENLSLLLIYSLPSDSNINYTDAIIGISSEVDSDYWVEGAHYTVNNNLNGTYSIIIFTGENVKINISGQNILHIHAMQQNVRNATRSYTFFINPIQTVLLTNQTLFEMPKYEILNFSIEYQTMVGAQFLDNASILILGISNYTINEISPGIYEIIISGKNESKSYSISVIASKQNYATATIDIVLIVRNLDVFTTINISQSYSSVIVGESTEFVLKVYYDYTQEYLTDQNITMTYQWIHGSGLLSLRNSTEFVLPINTQNIPPGEYTIIIYILDKYNNTISTQQVILSISAEPLPPWIYAIIGAALIAILMLTALAYYSRVYKPKKVFRNKALMDKYGRYLDAKNLQHLILINKDSGLRLQSKTYGKGIEINDDLIAGFLQAISSFGTEISGVDTAMENIKYKGSKLLLEMGKYTNCCFVLADEESITLKQKALKAIERFELEYKTELERFIGEVSVFERVFEIFDEIFEIYLAGLFKIDQIKYVKASAAFGTNKKKIMELILQRVGKTFTLEEIFTILHQVKYKLSDPEIFAELYDLIEKRIFKSSIFIDKLEYPSKGI